MRDTFGDTQSFEVDLHSDDDEDQSEEEEEEEDEPLAPVKAWDVFEIKPPAVDSGSAAAMVWVKRFEVFMLTMAYSFTFLIVLSSAVVSKGTTLFIMHQVSVKDHQLPYCNEDGLVSDRTKDYIVQTSHDPHPSSPTAVQEALDDLENDQIAWVWCLIFAYAAPEVIGTFLRSLRIVVLKSYHLPPLTDFIFVFIMETLHVIGLAVLAFLALPQLDSAHAVVLTNCLALMPGILLLMARNRNDR